MNTALLIYLYIVAGNFASAFAAAAFILAIGYFVPLSVMGLFSSFGSDTHWSSDELSPESKGFIAMRRHFKSVVIALAFLGSVPALYPDKDDVAWILGGAAAVHVAQTEEAKKLPDNLLRAANTFLEGISETESEQ